MGSFYKDLYVKSFKENTPKTPKKSNVNKGYKWYEVALGYGIIFSAIGALPFLGSNKEYYGISKKSHRYK